MKGILIKTVLIILLVAAYVIAGMIFLVSCNKKEEPECYICKSEIYRIYNNQTSPDSYIDSAWSTCSEPLKADSIYSGTVYNGWRLIVDCRPI